MFQLFEELLGREEARQFFSAGTGSASQLLAQTNFDNENLRVVRPFLCDNRIMGIRKSKRFRASLQIDFLIILLRGLIEVRIGFQDVLLNKLANRHDAAIQVHSSNERLDGI